jgi:hypothetical protein
MAKNLQTRIGELEDQLKQRDRRIEELREEIDEQRDLIKRFSEHAEDYTNSIEAWCDAFGMVMTDGGLWTWKPFWDEHNKMIDDYNDLVRRYNRLLGFVREPQPVGRPLGASESQVATVRKLHKEGVSLRGIMDETSLTFSTVRTIVGQIDHTDRTTQKRRERLGLEPIKIDRQQRAQWKRQKRTGNALPKRAQAVAEEGRALALEAKGLGKRKA